MKQDDDRTQRKLKAVRARLKWLTVNYPYPEHSETHRGIHLAVEMIKEDMRRADRGAPSLLKVVVQFQTQSKEIRGNHNEK